MTADDATDDGSPYADRIAALAERARRDRAAFEPPAEPPAEERALAYLREGLGPLLVTYVESRSGGRTTYFPPSEHDRIHRAMNDWLALYARCYGVEFDPDVPVRTGARLLIDTHDVEAVARILTGVPRRHGGADASGAGRDGVEHGSDPADR